MIYLSAPTWRGGGYWGFGYLGNDYEHYSLRGYRNNRTIPMPEALQADYVLSSKIEESLWEFCELAQDIYALNDMAQMLECGGSRTTAALLRHLIKNPDEVLRLNSIVIPACLDKLYELIS